MKTNRLLSLHSWGDNAHLTGVEFFVFVLSEFEYENREEEKAEMNGLRLSCAGVGVVAILENTSQLFLSLLPRHSFRERVLSIFNRKKGIKDILNYKFRPENFP